MRNLAADLVEGRQRGWDQLAAIRDEFVDQGFYDVTDDTAPGHSYGRIAAMLEDPERIVGFEEQYAAAAAVMAQVAELPVRVVVGYEIPPDAWQGGSAEVTASDISAWIEIDAGELGWIPVDVTPDRSRTPDPDSQGSTTEQVAIPNPPPPPPPPPQIEPPRQEEDEVDSDDEAKTVEHEFAADTGLAPWAVVAVGVAVVPIVPARAVRARRHRLEAAAAGPPSPPGVDHGPGGRRVGRGRRPLHRDRRAPPDRHDTARDGRRLRRRPRAGHGRSRSLRRLADQVDRAAFAAGPPSDEHADMRLAEQRRGRRRAAPPAQPVAAAAHAARSPSAPARRVTDGEPTMTHIPPRLRRGCQGGSDE